MRCERGKLYRTVNGSIVKCLNKYEVEVIHGGHGDEESSSNGCGAGGTYYIVDNDDPAGWPVYEGGEHPCLDIEGPARKRNKDR